ncbi:hypothetical protein L6494_08145 [Nostoc sp. UHCC 0870]|nr:hypothetical protein [Nostoc sp. UHCC 0870]UKO99665.1 hypothetical protein L6494_08145 [Nostoc sp. UHCC 0870]
MRSYENFISHFPPLFYIAIVFYLVIAYFLFKKWLFFFLEDKEMSSSQRSISRLIIGIVTVFWPIIVPIAYLELLNLHMKYKKEIDFLINQTDIRITDDNC